MEGKEPARNGKTVAKGLSKQCGGHEGAPLGKNAKDKNNKRENVSSGPSCFLEIITSSHWTHFVRETTAAFAEKNRLIDDQSSISKSP